MYKNRYRAAPPVAVLSGEHLASHQVWVGGFKIYPAILSSGLEPKWHHHDMRVYMHDGPSLMQMSEMLTYIPDLQYYVYCAACLYVAISSDINSEK